MRSPAEWRAYHDIRRIVLFEGRGLVDVYDETHPDDRNPLNHALLLLADGMPAGVVRVDFLAPSDAAAFRRVAIVERSQRLGYGRVMMREAEAFARAHGRVVLTARVARDAIGFWERIGYRAVEDGGRSSNPLVRKILPR